MLVAVGSQLQQIGDYLKSRATYQVGGHVIPCMITARRMSEKIFQLPQFYFYVGICGETFFLSDYIPRDFRAYVVLYEYLVLKNSLEINEVLLRECQAVPREKLDNYACFRTRQLLLAAELFPDRYDFITARDFWSVKVPKRKRK